MSKDNERQEELYRQLKEANILNPNLTLDEVRKKVKSLRATKEEGVLTREEEEKWCNDNYWLIVKQ